MIILIWGGARVPFFSKAEFRRLKLDDLRILGFFHAFMFHNDR